MNCLYCGKPTSNTIELGRGNHTTELPCCQECFDKVDKLPEERKNEMAEYSAMFVLGGDARTSQH